MGGQCYTLIAVLLYFFHTNFIPNSCLLALFTPWNRGTVYYIKTELNLGLCSWELMSDKTHAVVFLALLRVVLILAPPDCHLLWVHCSDSMQSGKRKLDSPASGTVHCSQKQNWHVLTGQTVGLQPKRTNIFGFNLCFVHKPPLWTHSPSFSFFIFSSVTACVVFVLDFVGIISGVISFYCERHLLLWTDRPVVAFAPSRWGSAKLDF